MVAVFRDHCGAPARRHGKSQEAAREHAVATLQDTGMLLLLQMLHPEKIPLVWQKRT